MSLIELRRIASEQFEDARTLFGAGRYNGSVYLCGYAVELSMKHAIAVRLGWNCFPLADGLPYRALLIHDLDALARFTGRFDQISAAHRDDWSIVSKWSPSMRYNGYDKTYDKVQANRMLVASTNIMGAL